MAVPTPTSYLAEADSAARRAAVSAVVWLVVAAAVGALAEVLLVSPGLLAALDLTYGPVRAIHDTALVFGWLTGAGLLALFAVVPRVAGIQLHNERLGRACVGAWNLALLAGILALLAGANQGRPLGELPVGVDVVLGVVLAAVAYDAGVTLARRRERLLYVSAWYLFAGAVLLPLVFAAGNITAFSGIADAIVSGFYVQGLVWLWLVPALVGALYYVVPKATGNPLHSRQLAVIGFWSLLLVAGWTGQRAGVWGPAQDYLETIAAAMSAVLLVPVLTAAANLFRTAAGRWGLLAEDFGLRFAVTGLGLLVAWTALAALVSQRAVARWVGLTAVESGLRVLGLWGALTAMGLGAVYHLYPRIVGRAWYSRRWASFHFWTTVAGTVGAAASLGAGGLVQGAAWRTWATVGDLGRLGEAARFWSGSLRPFHAAAAAGLALVAVGQVVFAYNAYRSATRGDPLHLAQPQVAVGSVA